ncbi:MAG: bifunctional nuclease family protein [Candidatus Marinimicrobia bacterium]|nr:bifunctional nuclease family protein [Candidatus Neomarinimicrobiota bacterium]
MSKNKEIAVKLEKLMYYPPSKGYALILVKKNSLEEDGLKLPIIIGAFEAQAIALALEKLSMPRPLTHDLFANFLEKMEYKVNKIVVNDLVNGTFYANIYMKDKENNDITMDSRPSDAIALALRVDAEIYVVERVFNEAGQRVEISDLDTEKKTETYSEGNQNVDELFDLQMQLQKAIDNENYELAAKLRDKIAKIEEQDKRNQGPDSGQAEA